MKICGIICEFNPFHNGHEYLLNKIRRISECDAEVCIMSGSFTQRGEICVADKFVRAKHAVWGGADCVLQLPATFSVAPAEIFARGAIKILLSIPNLSALAFGVENGTANDFIQAAKLLLSENETFKTALRSALDGGESYIKSYAKAFESVGGNVKLISNPNNVLGVEYTKALLRADADIEIIPVKRVGADYADGELLKNFSSAKAIRRNLTSPRLTDNVPNYVLNDLKDFSVESERYHAFLRLLLSRTTAYELKHVYGCNDGLENLLKSLQNLPLDKLIKSATSKRYTSSRIMRILCANFLNLQQADCEKYLKNDLYLSPLAVKKENADNILSVLSKSAYPLLTSGSDEIKLNEIAKKCKQSDDFSYEQWLHITQKNPINKMIFV